MRKLEKLIVLGKLSGKKKTIRLGKRYPRRLIKWHGTGHETSLIRDTEDYKVEKNDCQHISKHEMKNSRYDPTLKYTLRLLSIGRFFPFQLTGAMNSNSQEP